jgi:hypothetical protein
LTSLGDFLAPGFSLSVPRGDVGLESEFDWFIQVSYGSWIEIDEISLADFDPKCGKMHSPIMTIAKPLRQCYQFHVLRVALCVGKVCRRFADKRRAERLRRKKRRGLPDFAKVTLDPSLDSTSLMPLCMRAIELVAENFTGINAPRKRSAAVWKFRCANFEVQVRFAERNVLGVAASSSQRYRSPFGD